MTSPARALLFTAPVLALGGAVLVLANREPQPVPPVLAVAAAVSHGPSAAAAPEPISSAEVSPSTAALAPQPSALANPTDDSLAAAMHALEEASPARALELARQGRALWPSGPRAPEFAATEVKCLYRLGQPREGRGAAEAMVNQYAGSPWALEVEKQTGAHPYLNH